MRKITLILCFILVSICFAGCGSPLFETLFQEQDWSENYALAEGTTCTAIEMIDGDMNTEGMTVFPERIQGRTIYGAFPSAEAEVVLPEKKSIYKIVIHSEELSSFKVLASIGEKDEWKLLKEFEKNMEKEIVIRTSVVTDKIKIRARGKSTHGGTQRALAHGGVTTVRSISEPAIQEVELYGYK